MGFLFAIEIIGVVQNFPFRWKGYYLDQTTGFYYIGGRWYDPETGRYISAGYSCLDPCTIGGLNSYSICSLFKASNPLQIPPNWSSIFTSLPLVSDSTENDSDWNLPTWAKVVLGTSVIVVGGILTVATGGLAALPYYGAVVAVGGAIGAGFEMGRQAIFDGGINDWGAVGWSTFGGAAAAGLAYVAPGYGSAFMLGGTGSVVSGMMTSDVTNLASFGVYFGFGGGLNVLGRYVGTKVANKVSQMLASRAQRILANNPLVPMLGDTLEDLIGTAFNPIMNAQVSWYQNMLKTSMGGFTNSFMYIMLSEILSGIVSGWL